MKNVLGSFVFGLLCNVATQSMACSIDTPCEIDDRTYYIATPESTGTPAPAIVFVHGFGGSGKGSLNNTRMVDAYLERGYAVIAPDGHLRQGGGGRSWGFHPQSGRQSDDIAFLQTVRDDAIERFNLDPNRVILGGFSIGGSMTAYAACIAPDSFLAYVPVGGNFWRPHPTECAGPVNMLHTHGWKDSTVPYEGRVVNRVGRDDPSAFAQGDIPYAISLWRDTNNCPTYQARRFDTSGEFWRRSWTDCAPNSALTLALFDGGHVIPQNWPSMVIDWVEALPAH